MDKILVIDDELSQTPRDKLRAEIEEFGVGIEFTVEFIEAPVNIDDRNEIVEKYNPSVIFLDIVHKDRSYSIAKLIRKSIGSKVPILVLSNFSESDLKAQNKLLDTKKKDINTHIEQFEKETNALQKLMAQTPELKHKKRETLTGLKNFMEELTDYLKEYKDGILDKRELIEKIKLAPDVIKNFTKLKKRLDGLKVMLKSSGMSDYLGSYPTDFRQVIGYVIKSNFESMRAKIKNGIFAFLNPAEIILEISGPSIKFKNISGEELVIIKKKRINNTFKAFKKKEPLLLEEDEEKARKIASSLNKEVYEATDWRVREVLKNEGYGKYTLDVRTFIVNGETRWQNVDFSPKDDHYLQQFMNNITTKVDQILGEVQNLKKRVEKIEDNQ